MLSTDDHRQIRFWRPDSPSVAGMLRVEHEDRVRTTYSEHFLVVVVYEGAFDGWYRGAVRTHVTGAIKLKEPGEIHRDVRVHAPFTIQGAGFSHETVAAVAAELGLRGPLHFKASGFGPGDRATRLAFAMHAALVRPDVPEIERATLVTETLGEILGEGSRSGAARGGERARRAVRLARAFLHDALADKITLDDLATHAGLDKFHLVRAFRAEVGLPPYEYLTHARVSKARELLQRGALVADAAQAVGFYDESQLHRHFRRIIGIPPGRFSRSFAGPRGSQHRPIFAREGATHSPHESTDSQ
ncbi:MAG TPA: helix-turn-helix transcriptional regulator [Kofleriaceae bacterium]|jgi:AraC-like DNA-binding protein|nr:helix-turn-helix transcriptional regulator [Kofleriaceae bacterium]